MPKITTTCVVKALGGHVTAVAVNGVDIPFDQAEGADILLPSDDGPALPSVSLLISPDVLLIEQVSEDAIA